MQNEVAEGNDLTTRKDQRKKEMKEIGERRNEMKYQEGGREGAERHDMLTMTSGECTDQFTTSRYISHYLPFVLVRQSSDVLTDRQVDRQTGIERGILTEKEWDEGEW